MIGSSGILQVYFIIHTNSTENASSVLKHMESLKPVDLQNLMAAQLTRDLGKDGMKTMQIVGLDFMTAGAVEDSLIKPYINKYLGDLVSPAIPHLAVNETNATSNNATEGEAANMTEGEDANATEGEANATDA